MRDRPGTRRVGWQGPEPLTRKVSKEHPEFSNVGGKGDVCVQDDNAGQAGRQDAGQHELHQPIEA